MGDRNNNKQPLLVLDEDDFSGYVPPQIPHPHAPSESHNNNNNNININNNTNNVNNNKNNSTNNNAQTSNFSTSSGLSSAVVEAYMKMTPEQVFDTVKLDKTNLVFIFILFVYLFNFVIYIINRLQHFFRIITY